MGVKFQFKGHELHVDQYIRSMRLYVDGKQADAVNGFVETQLNDVTLKTVLNNSDHSEDRVLVAVKRQLLANEVTLYVNDEKMETKILL